MQSEGFKEDVANVIESKYTKGAEGLSSDTSKPKDETKKEQND